MAEGERPYRVEGGLRPSEVMRALVNADGIIVGPGSLCRSVLPVLLIPDVAATISGLEAVRVYVANLMTEPGETDAGAVALAQR